MLYTSCICKEDIPKPISCPQDWSHPSEIMSLHLGLVKAEGLSEPSGLHLQRLSAHSCLDVSSRSQIQHVSEETHHHLWPKTGFLSWLSDSCSFRPRPSDHLGSDTVPSPIHSFPSPFISNPVHVSYKVCLIHRHSFLSPLPSLHSTPLADRDTLTSFHLVSLNPS